MDQVTLRLFLLCMTIAAGLAVFRLARRLAHVESHSARTLAAAEAPALSSPSGDDDAPTLVDSFRAASAADRR